MTASIITYSAIWIYCAMVAFTLYLAYQYAEKGASRLRILLVAIFWFIFLPYVLIGAVIDSIREARNV